MDATNESPVIPTAPRQFIAEDDLGALTKVPCRLDRSLRMVALLDRVLDANTLTGRPIIVGGSAVEFYTTGGYSTQDIDLVLMDSRPAEAVLAASGFSRDGRYWFRPGLDLLLEFPGKALTYGPGAYDRVTLVEMPDGLAACIVGAEDIFIGRFYAGISESRPNDIQWARQIAILQGPHMDWEAVEDLARINGAQTVAALKCLRAELGF